MDDELRRHVEAWNARASSDLEVARLLIRERGRLLDAGAFHCQQAAEKAIKGWLASRAITSGKNHDLVALLALCEERDPAVARFAGHARALTPLATQYRYPGDIELPSPESSLEWLKLAEEIVAYFMRQSQG